MFESILVCLDGSSTKEAILPLVAELASHFGSKVILLNVIMTPTILHGPGKMEIEPDESTLPVKPAEDSNDYLETIAETWRVNGLDIECAIVEGTIEESILTFARTYEIGLIALAVHDHGAFSRFILGSTADYVIRKTGIPVLTLCPDNTFIKNQRKRPYLKS